MPRSEEVGSRVIGGRYRLESTIGRGAMGSVWSGTDVLLQRDVAVKEIRLSPGIPEDEAAELRERALREARAMAVLNHPNAVTLYDVAREGDLPFVVMELVRAQSLSKLLNWHGALRPHQLAVLVDGVAAALQAAHRVGIVHRDVKPGNVLLGRHRQVKLADFGIARSVAESTLTRTGVLVGTPAFVAPETAVGRSADETADLWSLGATVFAAAEGRLPYDSSGDPLITISSIVHGPVPQHRQTGPIGEVISGLMRKDPTHRMSLLEVRRRVQDLLRDAGETPFEPLLDADPPPRSLTHVAMPLTSAGAVTTPVTRRRAGRAVIVLGGLAVLLAAAAATAGFFAGIAERPANSTTAQSTPSADASPATDAEQSAYNPLQAESFATQTGDVTAGQDETGSFIGPIDNGDGVRIANVDFGATPARQVSARLRTWVDDGVRAKIEIRLDDPTGEVVGKINVTSTVGGQTWKTVPVDLQRPLSGKHDVYLTFAADQAEDFMNLDWLQFHH
ncbi:protein kinase [Saccharopolyspora sp. K220]|uniref:protein kinase domain-containing protein n=1 Tax=Saccharopolyspora soli TaxID=2926618 RepID=UPI001F5AB3C6|nr:protein kinase [Saccharopolyspora soli]MCI2417529.1 protein kinase [Saccharopolyspora soli]